MSGKTRGYQFDVDAWIQFHLLRLASFHPDTTKADLAVLAEIIQRYWGKYGNGWVTHEHLGAAAGISKATVIRAKRNLERLGFITVVQAGRRGSATVYTPNFALVPKKGVTDDTETKGVMDATESNDLGVTDDTESHEYGVMDATPTYIPDRPTRAESRIYRNDPAPATPPLSDGLTATAADGAGGGFEELWKAYDHRQRKAEARTAYEKITPDADMHATIVASALKWKAAWAAQGKADAPRFTLAKWIEREDYECDPPTAYSAKAKAATKKRAAPSNDNVSDDQPAHPSEYVMDVGPFSDFGTFNATIVGTDVEVVDQFTEKVVIKLKWASGSGGAEHALFYQHPDSKVQERGQAFIRSISDCLGIDEIQDTEELHGRRIMCTINKRFAISYHKAA